MGKQKTDDPASAEEKDATTTERSKAEEKKGKEKPVKEVEETEEDESSEEELQGVLDKPLVIEGKRERKNTEFLVQSVAEPKKEVKPLIFEGKGENLGSLERVNHELGKTTAFELKPLHRLLFGRDGRASEIKKNIRQFNGFTFKKDSKDYETKKQAVDRFTSKGLKRLCEILDLEKKGTRDDVLVRVLDFLVSPVPSGKKLPQKKSKGGTKKRKRDPPKKSKKSVTEDDDDENEEEEEDTEEEEEKEPPKKKVKKEKAKKQEKKTPSKRKEPVAVKIAPKKSPAKKTPKKEKPAESDESSDEEPLSTMVAKKQPTNKEIETLVKKLLEDANLEEVTMKSICKQVYDQYPSFDLTSKKDFIKETVKKVIS